MYIEHLQAAFKPQFQAGDGAARLLCQEGQGRRVLLWTEGKAVELGECAMSITISTDVFCDICSKWIHGGTGRKTNIRRARRKAKEAGWLRCASPFSGKMSDVCPSCTGLYKLRKEKDE